MKKFIYFLDHHINLITILFLFWTFFWGLNGLDKFFNGTSVPNLDKSAATQALVDKDGKVVWEIKSKIPDTDVELKWMTCLQELDNGNFIVGNCHAGPDNPQIFEINRDKEVVWQFNKFDIFGNGLASFEVLNDKQSALVRKLLKK